MTRVGAFPFDGATSKDAAISVALETADNTVRIASADGQPGLVLAELYDATPAAEFSRTSRRLLNVSVLKSVGGGVTAGFVVSGDASKSVLVRAVGPALGQAPFNLSGVSADPQLALFNGTTQIAASADWGKPQGASAATAAALNTAFAQAGAFPLPAGSRDAALIAELPPGSYTARVTGSEGVVVVEIYELR